VPDTTVSVIDIKRDLKGAVRRVMDRHGADGLAKGKPVYIKVNAVDFKPYSFTSPEVAGEVIDYCANAGASRIYLMDNCTRGNLTRMVFHISGLEKVAKQRGAEPLYLDEGRKAKVKLPHTGHIVTVNRHIKGIIDDRDATCYIGLPRMKTHTQAVMTLGVKNQYGLLSHDSRPADHNWKLHRKLADIFSVIRPDMTVVDGTVATIHGHYVPEALKKECLVPFNLLIAGTDTLAVDTVCARIFGYSVDEVPHLAEARDMGLGCADLKKIDVEGEPLSRFKKRYTHEIYDAFPHDVDIFRGTERCCTEGCEGNALSVLQLLYLDFAGAGDFSIFMGKGIDSSDVDRTRKRAFVCGPCAYEEVYPRLVEKLGKRNVFYTTECNDLTGIIGSLNKLMKVSALKMVPMNPLASMPILVKAKLNRSDARVAPIWPF
jgi:uncharacterized protein (DUF362 family)